jgi:hypothetical protein
MWSMVSGPGTVTFGNASAQDTTASFSQDGSYVLRLTASDGALSASDDVTVTVSPAPTSAPVYFSVQTATTVGGVAVGNEDIVYFDGSGFSLRFDGSDVGISTLTIDGFAWLDADSLLFSFTADKDVPGLGLVDDSDIFRFDATSLGTTTSGSFSLYFDGSDVGLTTSAHDVDAIELLPDDRILLSTTGPVTVGSVSAADEDLLAFAPTSLGTTTSGSFSLYFDGSDVGMTTSTEDVDAVAVDSTGRLDLSTAGDLIVTGLGAFDEDVFVFTALSLGATTTGSFESTLHFDGSSFGLDANDIFAVDLEP